MATCPICGGSVTGERGGAVFWNGRYYHTSCLREWQRRRWRSPFGRRRLF